ncbi:MAG: CBS domain-containing protein [Firmicutes bacterium]|jgi:CBS-domain-containing membrane protein|nr:CBS domain-containing protein [Bacillota bacterium]
MNIAFFLLPKQEVVYLSINGTMRQALEKMEYHRYTAIPLIDEEGKYAGTLTEGDMLWKLKRTPGLSLSDANSIPLKEIPRQMQNEPVRIDAQIEDLLALAANQNFVPVVDDHDVFIGIVRRSEIINYCIDLLKKYKQTT